MNFNQVLLGGRLTRKPETRYAQSGTAVVKFGLAVNRRVKKGDEWVEKATFVDVTMFGKRGEAFAKFHDKGSEAFVVGVLELDQWDDKQSGERRSKLHVIADSFEFVGGKSNGNGGQGRQQSKSGDSFTDEVSASFGGDDMPF